MNDKAKQNLQEFLKSISIPYRVEEEAKRGPRGFTVLIAPE